MNSPPEQDSPLSTPSSGSRTPDEIQVQTTSAGEASSTRNILQSVSTQLANQPGQSSKRRLHSGGAPSNRDPKTRRRDDPRKVMSGGGPDFWAEGGGKAAKKEKEELLDQNVVDWLRKELGDPFFETAFSPAR
ncbi:hypothetical protein VNI00_000772 [Paramarasmius palmivorus]|uniref:Uncharacterized protein n=1 Tax=Paramarasmius palmivorus TaxID=297713 RepID=A0AAW0E9I6_9AGAR